jgi:hypothetical protein
MFLDALGVDRLDRRLHIGGGGSGPPGHLKTSFVLPLSTNARTHGLRRATVHAFEDILVESRAAETWYRTCDGVGAPYGAVCEAEGRVDRQAPARRD